MKMLRFSLIVILTFFSIQVYGQDDIMGSVEEEPNFSLSDEMEDNKSLSDLEHELHKEDKQSPKLNLEENKFYNIASLRIINKITAQSENLKIKVGDSAFYGNIEIYVLKCFKKQAYEGIDNQILIRVVESKIDEDPKEIFYGWLFSYNKSLNSLEHPVYYIDAVDCKD